MNYKQCVLEMRKDNGSVLINTTWLPEKYAVKGKILELKNRDTGEWTKTWKVTMVGTQELTQEQVIKQSRWHANHRNATDI